MGYSETGSSLNLTVGEQGFGVIDARLGLDGTFGIEGRDAILNASGGLFIQANPGSTNVPVTFLGQTQNAALSGTTEIGLYGGLGLKAQISSSVALTADADAQFNFPAMSQVRCGLASSRTSKLYPPPCMTGPVSNHGAFCSSWQGNVRCRSRVVRRGHSPSQ